MQLTRRKTSKNIVLGVDVGTTNIKCYAYDRFANIIGTCNEKIQLLSLGEGRSEIAPNTLWKSFKKVVDDCLLASQLHANEISCMGISTQRATFITWNRETGDPYHNFITWQDKRSQEICNRWNSSFLTVFLKIVSFLLYTFTQQTKFQVFSKIRFIPAMVLPRLYWVLENIPMIQTKNVQKKLLFGTIDTWLLWKLTGGKVHATDTSNACVTGFFDPFKLDWSNLILNFFKIPKSILPSIKNTSDTFGETLPEIFGSPIPICCLVGDQQASMFGASCFQKYDLNITMGTGSFLCLNTGDSPSFSYPGIYPLVGWTIDSKTTYMAECGMHNSGCTMEWLKSLGFLKNLHESSHIAQTIKDGGGVHFLPSKNPFKDPENGKFVLVDLGINTTKEQIVRSVLESLAFQVGLLFETVYKLYLEGKTTQIKISGGISKNDFIVQTISDIASQNIHRLKHGETSSLGASFLAGLHYGVWETQDDLKEIQREVDFFTPKFPAETQAHTYTKWKENLERVSFNNCC